MEPMKPHIKYACPEKWEHMKLGMNSRFCDNCQKDVIDFTNKSREEILEYLLQRRDQQVCGRVQRSQLDFSNTDYLVTIEALAKKHKHSNLAFYLLAAGAMTLASCGPESEDATASPTSADTVITQPVDSVQKIVLPDSSHSEGPTCKQDSIDIMLSGMDFIQGDIVIPPPDTTMDEDGAYHYPQVMPEFKNGIDSLYAYMKANTIYPEKAIKSGQRGKVFVGFIIDEQGKIVDPEIMKGISSELDAEALRVIREMPDWIPGMIDGKPVKVKSVLPITFKLKK